MIPGIASLTFIPLLAISMVHMLWAFGASYPVKDQASLARTVAGFKGIDRMPPKMASFGMSLAALAAGIWALALTDESTSWVLTAGGIFLSLVFLGRGAMGYMKFWRELTPEEPFATLDKKFYSPLSLGMGLGFTILTALRIF